jgi:hypothetical protein
MNQLNPTDEVEYILEILAEDPGLQLRAIHEQLVGRDPSMFTHSPPRGEGYNLERYIVKGLVEFLSEKEEMITAEGAKWSLTQKGRNRVN